MSDFDASFLPFASLAPGVRGNAFEYALGGYYHITYWTDGDTRHFRREFHTYEDSVTPYEEEAKSQAAYNARAAVA